jgi:cytoskeletal protein RodZ
MRNISEILKDEREKKGLSLEDVVEKTKIKKNFLTAIETGKFNQLPSESYALGFVKNYAEFLGINQERASALFRREYEAKKIDVLPKFRKTQGLLGKKIILRSPKSYLIFVVIFIVATYVFFQFRFLLFGPELLIHSPKNGDIIKKSTISVTGKTDPYATVLINGEEVYVDLTGTFRKTLYVYTGEEKIDISSKNQSGKETKKEIKITVK